MVDIVTIESRRNDPSYFWYIRQATISDALTLIRPTLMHGFIWAIYCLISLLIYSLFSSPKSTRPINEKFLIPAVAVLVLGCVTWFMRGRELRWRFRKLYFSEWMIINLLVALPVIASALDIRYFTSVAWLYLTLGRFIEGLHAAGELNSESKFQVTPQMVSSADV